MSKKTRNIILIIIFICAVSALCTNYVAQIAATVGRKDVFKELAIKITETAETSAEANKQIKQEMELMKEYHLQDDPLFRSLKYFSDNFAYWEKDQRALEAEMRYFRIWGEKFGDNDKKETKIGSSAINWRAY